MSHRGSRIILAFVIVLGSQGCVWLPKITYPVPSLPYDGYPAVAPIPLGVELVLTNEFVAAHWEQNNLWVGTIEILLGPLLAKNAEALARATFSDVAVSRGSALQAGSAPAVLTPRVVTIDHTPMDDDPWHDIRLTVVLEWRLEARGGTLVWLDTVTGSGTSGPAIFSAKEVARARISAAMEVLFRTSSEAMRRSPEIARFAAKTAMP